MCSDQPTRPVETINKQTNTEREREREEDEEEEREAMIA